MPTQKLMETITTFFEHNIIIVYFFYGLAFFCMGLIVLLESRRTSALRLSGALFFLAMFGIIHGLHEWFEMFQKLGATSATAIPSWLLLDELRIAHLVVSFVLLIMFGVHLIFVSRHAQTKNYRLAIVITTVFVICWLASVFITRWLYKPVGAEFLTAVDVLARYILGIPGALLAVWAIILEQRSFRDNNLNDTGRDLLRAALALFLYGLVGQIFTAPTFLFPANIINADLFVQIFGIPVQLFRATMAILIALFVIRALRAFETERQRNLSKANEERLIAQRKALTVQEQARQEMEHLNQELQTAVQDLTLLFNLSRTLATTLNREELLARAINEITAYLPRFARGIIVLRQKPGKPLECAACTGHLDCQTTSPCQQAQMVTKAIEETAVSVCLTDNQLTPLTHHAEPNGEILLPIAPDSAIGVITVSLSPNVGPGVKSTLYNIRVFGSVTRVVVASSRIIFLGSRPKGPCAPSPKLLTTSLNPVVKSTLNKRPLFPVPVSSSITSALFAFSRTTAEGSRPKGPSMISPKSLTTCLTPVAKFTLKRTPRLAVPLPISTTRAVVASSRTYT